MKKISILVMAVVLSGTSFAQSEKYTATMKTTIADMDTSFRNGAKMQELANKFERIANAEKNQWLAYYYAALCHVNYAYAIMEKDKSSLDGIADKASDLLIKADSLMPGNSEISCVRSMIAITHIMVDPMGRWMQYGQESSDALDEAIKQDATNPRPHVLRATTLRNTPEQFGGGCGAAKPEFETALKKFESFKPASDISPTWGKGQAEAILKTCK